MQPGTTQPSSQGAVDATSRDGFEVPRPRCLRRAASVRLAGVVAALAACAATLPSSAAAAGSLSWSAATPLVSGSPSLTANASPSNGYSGPYSDVATLTGGDDPTGTLTWQVFGPEQSTCSGPSVMTETKSVDGDGQYTAPAVMLSAPGAYYWDVTYSGDGNNSSVGPVGCESPAQSVAVYPGGGAAITTAASPPAVLLGDSVTDVATLTNYGGATGTLTWQLYGPQDAACQSSAPLTTATVNVTGSGQYTSPPLTPAAIGTYHWVLKYSGDANLRGVGPLGCTDPNDTVTVSPVRPDLAATVNDPTRATSALFDFNTDPGDPGYQCSLDEAAFSTCISPQAYSGLADGAHTFRVREVYPGGNPGQPAEYDWSVDTQPPTVTVDSVPTAGVDGTAASTIVFHGTAEDGHNSAIAFTCSVDGAKAVPCSSPDVITGLAQGAHTISIVAQDDLGNMSATPAVATWSIGDGGSSGGGGSAGGGGGAAGAPASGVSPPPASSCAAPATNSAANGDLVMVARDGACISPAQLAGVDVWQTRGPVTLNGITVIPDAGTALTLTRSGSAPTFASSGGVSLQLGGLATVHDPLPVAWVQGLGGLLSMNSDVPLVSSLAGMAAKIDFAAIDMSPAQGGSTSLTLTLTLPSSFSSLPGSPSDVAGQLTLTTSNDEGLSAAGKLTVGSVYLGPVQLKDLELGFDAADNTFDGSVGVVLGPAAPTIATSVTIGPPSASAVFGCCVRAFSLGLQDIDKPIPGTPLFLQSIGGSVNGGSEDAPFVTISGNAEVSIGPKVGPIPAAVQFDGALTLGLSDPWTLALSGSATVASFPLANGKATYTEGGGVQLQGEIQANVEGYGLSAEVKPGTFFQGTSKFNIDAVGTVTLGALGSEQGEVVFSDKGLAACATVNAPWWSYGLGWGEPRTGPRRSSPPRVTWVRTRPR